MRSPHIWQVPCPQRKIMLRNRSMQTGHIVCRSSSRLKGPRRRKQKIWWRWAKKILRQRIFLTCSLISCSCCWSFWTSVLLLSRHPLFIIGPSWGEIPVGRPISLLIGLRQPGESVAGLFKPQQTTYGITRSICERHWTHFFIRAAQPSQAHMWPHGRNNTDAFLSEQTTHSSI